MRYEYDSKVNRELARTAMDIYKKAHNIVEVEQAPQEQVISESAKYELNEVVSGLIVGYVSNTIVLAEQRANKEFTNEEIEAASDHLLNEIEALSNDQKAQFIAELAENHEAQQIKESH